MSNEVATVAEEKAAFWRDVEAWVNLELETPLRADAPPHVVRRHEALTDWKKTRARSLAAKARHAARLEREAAGIPSKREVREMVRDADQTLGITKPRARRKFPFGRVTTALPVSARLAAAAALAESMNSNQDSARHV